MITGAQIRMARGYLRWSARDLAEKSGLSITTIKRMEEVDDIPNAMSRNLGRIHQAIVSAGLELVTENGGGGGVRLRKK